MRKPRAIEAELAALAERAAQLKARRTVQLGELVIASGADGLGADILMGALLAAAAEADEAVLTCWHARGEAYFRDGPRGGPASGRPQGRADSRSASVAASQGRSDAAPG